MTATLDAPPVSKPARKRVQLSTTRKAGRSGVVAMADLPQKTRDALATPANFSREFLKMKLSPQQAEVMDAMGPVGSHVTAAFCNEAGKTTKVITGFILWHCLVWTRRGENGGVVTTSGSWPQITNQLVPALRSYQHLFPKWEFAERTIKINGIPNWMAFSVTDVGRAEGAHGAPENPLAAIVDEAKSVRDGVFRALEDRCRPQRLAYLSSPGYAQGRFYESHTASGQFYQRFKVTVDQCPWIDRTQMRRAIEQAGGGDYEKGLQDPLIRSAYFAEFMPFIVDALLGLDDIGECLADPPKAKPGDRRAFCDFAAGGDENVLAVRLGNRVWIQDAWRDSNTMSAVGRFVSLFNKLKSEIGLRPEDIDGDADGMGKPMCDALEQAGWPVNLFYNNGTPGSPDFTNVSAEVWHTGCEAIKARKVIIPDDPLLHAQLVDRKAKFSSDGKRAVESKKDLFARQRRDQRPERSPDRADALLGAMQPGRLLRSQNLFEQAKAANPTKDNPFDGESVPSGFGVDESVLEHLGGALG